MSVLNGPAYGVEKDKLIYDNTYPIDGDVVPVNITADTSGVIERGTVIDFDESNGEYTLHKASGKPSRIVAENTEYEAEDATAVVPTYAGGTFRASEIIADPDLDEADVEELRKVGIHLK